MFRNRYYQLLAQNKATKNREFSVVKNEETDDTTILLYDVIVDDEWDAEYWGGVCPETFVSELSKIDTDNIHVRINSPGGSVFAANSIAQALIEHKATINVHIDGIAASAASRIAVIGDNRFIAQGAAVMIHKAWTIGIGNSDDFLALSNDLIKTDDALARIYESNTKAELDTIKTWMKDETWFYDDDAIEHGFVDAMSPTSSRTVESKNQINWNLNAFINLVNRPKPRSNSANTDVDSANSDSIESAKTRLRLLNLNKMRPDAQ